MPARAEQGAGPFVPDDRTLSVLQEAVALYLNRGRCVRVHRPAAVLTRARVLKTAATSASSARCSSVAIAFCQGWYGQRLRVR